MISRSILQTAPQQVRIVASSSEWTITSEDFDQILKTLPPEGQQRFSIPANRRDLLNELVRIWVLSTEAGKNGINVGTDYESRRTYYVNYANDIGSKITLEAVRKYYDDHLESDFTQVGFSHILILNGDSPLNPYPDVERLPYAEAEKKAKEIKAMLDKGADWDTLSKEYSQDRSVAATGGAVGYVSKSSRAAKSIVNAVFAMKVGEISDVVGSAYGFHILKVTDRKIIPFEELRDRIREKLKTDEVNRQLDLKVKEAKVTIDESFFAQ